MKLNRRDALAGITAFALTTRTAFADDSDVSPLAVGPLANNKLAQAFKPTRHSFPEVNVVGPDGTRPIAEIIAGKIVLMPLWAEWCGPCMTELGDFARLQKIYGNDRFAIIPILTGPNHKFTPATLGQLLHLLNAGIFSPLMEEDNGKKLFIGMAQISAGPAIPCNLLVGSDGHVIAREIGLEDNDNAASTNKERLNEALAGNSQSLWGTSAGDEFAASMSNGSMKL